MAVTESLIFEPAYLHLHRSGELVRRVERALELLRCCQVCPRHCRVNRLDNKFAVCRTGRYATVSSYAPHQIEATKCRCGEARGIAPAGASHDSSSPIDDEPRTIKIVPPCALMPEHFRSHIQPDQNGPRKLVKGSFHDYRQYLAAELTQL